MRDVSFFSLAASYSLILVFVGIAWFRKLRISREVFFSSLQGVFQLIAIGFVIAWLFKVENLWILAGVIFIMCSIASYVASRRWKKYKGLYKLVTLAVFTTTYLTLGLLVLFGSIEWAGKFVIPIGGMLIGQTMNNCSLFLERVIADVHQSKLLVESNLALGASAKQAIADYVNRTLRADSMPMIDTLKTLGLIYLPGMMAGLIVAGADPVLAVKYQLVVIFMITFAFGFSSLILALGVHHFFFTSKDQFLETAPDKG